MLEHCRHCGRALPRAVQLADDLMVILRADRRRDVYKVAKGGYAISYSGGPITKMAISEALARGLIQQKHKDRGDYEWWELAEPVPHPSLARQR